MIHLPNPYKKWLRGPYTKRRDIQEVIRQTCITCDIKELYPEIKWWFSNRLDAVFGVAEWGPNADGEMQWSIKFASKFWMGITPPDRKNTIVHEVCHFAVEHHHGHGDGVKDHGDEWRAFMALCGEDPDKITCGDW